MDKEQKAIKRIQMASEMSLHHYGKPLVCTYSGGKDSDVMLELFKRSGIPFEVHNSHTTADAPHTVYHIRNKRRRVTELCMQRHKMTVNPIIDWTHTDVWEFIRSENIDVCELYQCGYSRVGCIGCPMVNKTRWKEFSDFPQYKKLYIHAFDRMLKERKRRGKESKWKTAEEVFLWWMEDDNIPGQMSIEDFTEVIP